jgi:hypothetical protein
VPIDVKSLYFVADLNCSLDGKYVA